MSTAEKTALAVTKLVETYSAEFEKVLPRHMRMDHFMRCAVTYIKKNPGVGECTRESIMKSLMDAAQLGLAPDGLLGSAYLVPFNNKVKGRNGESDRWEKTCQLIPGYRGMIDLARRSDQILSIVARPVLDSDEFGIDWGRPVPITHRPNLDGDPDSNPEKVRGIYALATLKDGTMQCEYMSRAQIDRIKNLSQAAKKGFSPWQTHWTEMGRKTVVKRLCKYLPLSPELARLMQYDHDTEVVHDVEVQQQEAPPASKADKLAKQLKHEPREDLQSEVDHMQAEREAAEDAAIPANGEDAERAHTPTSAAESGDSASLPNEKGGESRTVSTSGTAQSEPPFSSVEPDTLTPKTKVFVRTMGPKVVSMKPGDMSDTDLNDAHDANEAALADSTLKDDEKAHRLGVKALLEAEYPKRKKK